MMRLIAAVLLLASPLQAATPAQRLDAILKSYFPADGPGAAVLVIADGKPLLRNAYGLANVELNVPMRPNHVFRIGSLTRQFTAAAILNLVEQKKLTLDTKLAGVLPGWPESITIEHLLSHTSGIPDYGPRTREDLTPPQMLARFKDLPLDFAPGTQSRISNSGYYLLGLVIEKLSGMPYAGFLRHHFFMPLGMSATQLDTADAVVPKRVSGYTSAGGKTMNAPFISMTQAYAAGGLLSTVDDLAKWFSGHDALVEAIEQGGGIEGFSSYVAVIPSKKIVVVVLTNTDTPPVDPGFIAAQAASFALGKPYDPKPIAVPIESLDAYTGTYRSADGALRTICREGSQLISQRLGAGGRRSPIQPLGKDRFFYSASFLQAQFERDASGAVTAMSLERPGAAAERAVRVSGGGCAETH